ncbi:Lon protease 2 [bioreactor metagenome]|uniref:Lon protease 2 n=1 Tax=bioreactor metagenome TaxID=1076179 RepID=A0A644WZQ2_9ZZZZ
MKKNKKDILRDILFSDALSSDGEFIPLMSMEDEKSIQQEDIPDELPIMPLRNTVLFPGVIIPITVGREKSIQLVRSVYKSKRIIGVVAQKDAHVEDPEPQDLFGVGTVAYIIKLLQMPDDTVTVIIQGRSRFQIDEFLKSEPYFVAKVHAYGRPQRIAGYSKLFPTLMSTVKETAMQILKEGSEVPAEARIAIENIESPWLLMHMIASNLKIQHSEKQKLLEMTDLELLGNELLKHLTNELKMLEIKEQIHEKVKTDIDKQQRDYFLNMQLKTIQEELGGAPHEQEIKDLQEKAAKKIWPENVAEVFDKEMSKLKRMNPSAAEFSIQLNYLEFMVELPWSEFTSDNMNLDHARIILDEDHYGLEKVKERIIEYLAVLQLKGDMKSPILCLLGPPGVGKTSLGRSIARALERKYIRMSLGGLRDESELRGHRKTYIGAMPGRIIQNLKKVKSSNPVFVLDEIDKVSGNTMQGDPQAALLEVLDPEQNNTFYDNYLEVDYDLSKILFIATANNLSTIHPALRDRMEIIELSGYTQEEKLEIAKRHLIPKQLNENGMAKSKLKFSDKVVNTIISDYTRESGVRALEKTIAKVIRHFATDFAMGKKIETLKPEHLEKILGIPSFQRNKAQTKPAVGLVTGLAWTVFGGEILYVEATLSKGKGMLTMTGNLGEVMKESATLAYEYLKSHAKELKIDTDKMENHNVHIHVPEGATPKDGPSAGITIFTALTSVLLNKPVRNDIAMTGEITLRGKVLPVGGIKEKILAARRSGIKTIVLSEENRKDLSEIEDRYLEDIKFHFIKEMKEVLPIVL